MNKKLTLVSALAVAAALPAAGLAQKTEQQLSIDATPDTVTFGKDLKITGALTGGTAQEVSDQNITLQRDDLPYDGRFERVDGAKTDATGNYVFTLKPVANAKYRTVAKGGVESSDVTVPVRVAVTRKVSDRTLLGAGRVKFSGTVAPPHDGKVARIQRRTSTGWKTVGKATLTDGGDIVSKYSKRVRVTRSGRYRVRFNPADMDHVAGNSRRVRITVG
jgi:hypothetical protein